MLFRLVNALQHWSIGLDLVVVDSLILLLFRVQDVRFSSFAWSPVSSV